MINYKKVNLLFPKEREEKLRNIKRFSMMDVFLYRSSLWHHALRVYFIVDKLSGCASKTLHNYNEDKASVLALVHDDAEMITGDIQLGHKQLMNETQLQQLEKNEAAAIEELSEKFPKMVEGFSYKELLHHALYKDCVEAQLVSYADKVDAYCESLHDLLAGNITALRSVINYVSILKDFKQKYPLLAPIFSCIDNPFVNIGLRVNPGRVHREYYTHLNKPHTPESLKVPTELVFYNTWRDLVIENLGEEGIQALAMQQEEV